MVTVSNPASTCEDGTVPAGPAPKGKIIVCVNDELAGRQSTCKMEARRNMLKHESVSTMKVFLISNIREHGTQTDQLLFSTEAHKNVMMQTICEHK